MEKRISPDGFLTSKLAVYALVCTLLTLFSGCANLTSIHRSNDIPSDAPHLVSIDAKQRVVLSNPNKGESDDDETTSALVRFCAEPPPDVFTALATSLGAEASVSRSASSEAAAKLAATISENAATIERTQTVNILREAMYRNCERYLSGAISNEEFIVQAARDQQLIVQVLAVEQITGVARAQSTALTTVAKAAASGVTESSLSILSEAKKDLTAKRLNEKTILEEAKEVEPKGPCGDSPIDETNPPDGVTAEKAKAKNTKCKEAETAAKLAKEADEYYTLIKSALAKQGNVSSEARGQLATASLTATEASAKIAKRVVEIVRQYQAFDEVEMSCVVKLRKTVATTELDDFCKDLLSQMVKTRLAQLQLEEQQLNAERIQTFRTVMESASQSMADSVWTKLGQNFTSDKLKALADKAGVTLANRHKLRIEAANENFPTFLKAFKKLAADIQEKLAGAAAKP